MNRMTILLSICILLFACNESETPAVVSQEVPAQVVEAQTLRPAAEVAANVVEAETAISETEPTEKAVEPKREAVSEPKEAPRNADRETPKKERPKARKTAAKMEFEESTYDFGEIKEGEIIEYKFKFRNDGESNLEIRNVTATCGCTQPSFPFLPIAPGEEGYIGVTFNSTGKVGTQKPTVTVYSTAEPRTHKLYFTGYVRPKE